MFTKQKKHLFAARSQSELLLAACPKVSKVSALAYLQTCVANVLLMSLKRWRPSKSTNIYKHLVYKDTTQRQKRKPKHIY
jgi:hypothetical protein